MSLINLVIVLIVIGVLLYVVNLIPFIDGKIKQIINVAVVIVTLLWLLQLLVGPLPDIRIGR